MCVCVWGGGGGGGGGGGWVRGCIENHAVRVVNFHNPCEKSYDLRKCSAKFHSAKMLGNFTMQNAP